MRARSIVLLFAALVGCELGCKPDLGDRDSLVSETRILAVRGEPPEAKLGDPVTYSVLIASPDDAATNGPYAWAYCASPKTVAENEIVSSACVGDGVVAFARPNANDVTDPLPGSGCTLFGPDTPPGNFRPRDPDGTGGFFQPVRVTTPHAVAFGLERIVCNLANAPADAAQDFKMRYVANKNPHLAPFTLGAINAGAHVDLRATWTDADAETYVAFDIASQTVVTRRESMRVSWFSTGGTFDTDRTGRDESDLATFSENGWTAPAAGPVTLWIVLRDSRGGIDFAKFDWPPRS